MKDASPEECLGYLLKAKHHFDDGLTGRDFLTSSISKDFVTDGGGLEEKFDAVMSEKEATRYLRTVNLQIEVSSFAVKEPKFREDNPPTLFAGGKKRIEICVKLLLLDNFDLAFKIMQEYRLNPVEIYVHAARAMARQKQVNRLTELFKNIKSLVNDDDWDKVLEAVVYVFCREVQDIKLAEKFMPMINGDANKINAFIISGKLRNAYLHAIKVQRYSDIEKIRQEAIRTQQNAVVQLCDKFLSTQQES